MLQQAAEEMSVSLLHGNVCATTSFVAEDDQFHLRALKQSLVRVERLLQMCGWLHVWRRLVLLLLAVANVTSAPPLQAHRVTDLCTDVAALALRDGTDVAALALCVAVAAGGADCLRGAQQSCPDGKVLVCFDDHPDIHLDPLLVPAPLPCPGSSLLQRLADLPFASISMLFHPPKPSLGGTQPVTAHTPIHKAQAPPLLFGWSGMQHPEWPWRGMVHSLLLRDMVAAETAREEARSLDFYAAIEAADAIAVDFHPGFASAVFDSFGVGDTVAVAARGVACGGLAEVEEMAEGEALGAVLDEGEDEWDLREGCSVQSGACVGGI